ncbi:cytochrome c oxidase assembly protein [Pseudonocardia oroxyli]|uniref:Cytochrome c oxidase assembly factor CtaG n=1 Tax=Pseudonocardia oroxyli TaxID=366584 RepID=A0A1G7WME9_PSEOR|nr:cytochrome c oxidase assembly protein [Pseudonocardia oroxyli]SDG73084.1 Cytochrome c oxidase assembly factor CtaG [Pseudonocardia oroxyli]
MSALAAVPPLTWARVATAWRFEPGVVAVAAVLGGGYAAGVRRCPGRPRSRSWCAAVAVVLLLVVGCSFLGVYSDVLFWVRAAQNILLLMVVPMLLAAAAPLTLLAATMPAGARRWCSRVLHSRPAVWATLPPVVSLVLVVPILVLYLSPLYEQTLRSAAVSAAAGTALVLSGFVYFWTRFRIDPVPRAGSHLVTLAITIVEMIGDAVLGLVVWLGPLIAVGFYAALGRQWGPDLRTDQVLGAGVLWAGGDVVGLPFIGVVVARMAREDEAHGRRVDAELDRASAAADAESDAESDNESDNGSEAVPSRLWWEDDPQLADRFRRPLP